MSRRLIAVAAIGAATAASAAPAMAGSTPSRTVRVGDNFFSPTRLTVDQGTRLVFRWQAANFNLHDVVLTDAPSGVDEDDFTSAQRSTNYTFRRTVRRAGTYKFICSLHPTQMRLTVRVRRG
jgi:plastocyanin